MRAAVKISAIAILILLLSVVYLFYNTDGQWAYALEKRTVKILAIGVVSCSVAYSSIAFQTLTQNKILTPSIMGFEAVYLLFQTILVFLYGDATFRILADSTNFLLSIFCMMLFAFVIYAFLFRKEGNNMYFLLLTGLILGTLFSTMASFMQLLIDPNEFLIIEGKMFASFNKINTSLLWVALAALAATLVLGRPHLKKLDVLSLGKADAISLGVDYHRTARTFLFIIAIQVAVSTALVGPLLFLGILVTHLTYELFPTFRHRILIPACSGITAILLISGQFLTEHVFNYTTTISIIINFTGGIYFMYLLLKARKI